MFLTGTHNTKRKITAQLNGISKDYYLDNKLNIRNSNQHLC